MTTSSPDTRRPKNQIRPIDPAHPGRPDTRGDGAAGPGAEPEDGPSERELLRVPIPVGGRVLVASDIHLGAVPSATSEATTNELAKRLDALTGPAALVLAGDTFEMWAEPNNSPAKALRAHPRFTEAIQRFAEAPGRQVVVLAGNHDGAIGWDERFQAELAKQIKAKVAIAVDLDLTTGAGRELIRVEHGHQLDTYNAFNDPLVPGDRPLGQHVANLLVPTVAQSQGADSWMADLAELNDPAQFPGYVASRLFYRRLARHLWWTAVPGVLLALIWLTTLRLSPLRSDSARLRVDALGLRWPLALVAVGLVVDIGLVLLGLMGAARRSVSALESLRLDGLGDTDDPNAAARRRAVTLAADGYRGLITGHTHRPEVIELDGAFYANSGCNSSVVQPVATWSGLPGVFEAVQQNGWLELGAGPQLSVDVWYSQASRRTATALERLAIRRPRNLPSLRPIKVATLEPHRRWPASEGVDRHRRSRQIAAISVAVAGVVDVVSSLTPPVHSRILGLFRVVPHLLPSTASAFTATAGAGLLLLAASLRRGQRRAWAVACALLVFTVVTNLGKGLDVEEAAVALVVAGFLISRRRSFRAVSDPLASRRALVLLALMAVTTVVSALAAAWLAHVSVQDLITDFAQRVLGLNSPPVPRRWQPVSAAVSGLGVSTVVYAAWLLLRPHRAPAADPEADAKAWQLVRRYGRGTLDYFALRDDKTRFVTGSTVVAYSVRHGIALVSPDPIGPSDERSRAWRAFQDYAASRGWSTAVLAASEEWLPIYDGAGMFSIYAGDEAVVDVTRFSLEGGRNKHLRQAAARVERAGFTVSLHRSADIDEQTARELRALMGQSRKGEVERGYSMTLSRLFDPRDDDLLLAVARDGDGRPAAFCQFVPAPGIGGYSLDLMRRADGDLPNGLTDFVIIRTLEYLKAQGQRGLCLNFATMRAVLAGDVVDSWMTRRQRWILRRLGDSMQIESLWRFNAKYDPLWTPRYLVVDGADRVVPTALAVAGAESLWELPLLGRFLRRGGRSAPPEPEGDAAADQVPVPVPSGKPKLGQPVTPKPPHRDPAAIEPVVSEPVAASPVVSDPAAGELVAGELVVGELVAGETVAGELVVGEPVGSSPVAGRGPAGDEVAPG